MTVTEGRAGDTARCRARARPMMPPPTIPMRCSPLLRVAPFMRAPSSLEGAAPSTGIIDPTHRLRAPDLLIGHKGREYGESSSSSLDVGGGGRPAVSGGGFERRSSGRGQAARVCAASPMPRTRPRPARPHPESPASRRPAPRPRSWRISTASAAWTARSRTSGPSSSPRIRGCARVTAMCWRWSTPPTPSTSPTAAWSPGPSTSTGRLMRV